MNPVSRMISLLWLLLTLLGLGCQDIPGPEQPSTKVGHEEPYCDGTSSRGAPIDLVTC